MLLKMFLNVLCRLLVIWFFVIVLMCFCWWLKNYIVCVIVVSAIWVESYRLLFCFFYLFWMCDELFVWVLMCNIMVDVLCFLFVFGYCCLEFLLFFSSKSFLRFVKIVYSLRRTRMFMCIYYLVFVCFVFFCVLVLCLWVFVCWC